LNDALLLLGGNLGKREKSLKRATQMIEQKIGTITDRSSVYETAPWGFSSNNAFLNQVIRVETMQTPQQLLETILAIEKEIGRTRTLNGYNSRLIDIDILLIDKLRIHERNLDIPHPRMHLRNFVLVPLTEIAGEWIHPELNMKISEIAENCMDPLKVEKFRNQNSTINRKRDEV